jgi:integrase
MARRSYGTGSLTLRTDSSGRESWYGLWMAGGRRMKRRLGAKRIPGAGRDGLSRTQAERELRRLMAEHPTVVARESRKTVAEAGAAYVAHLEEVMGRKRTTIQDYRGYLRRHLGPHFGQRTLDRIEPEQVETYLHTTLAAGLSSKTVTNHLTFLHGLFRYAVKRRWTAENPVACVDRPPCAFS